MSSIARRLINGFGANVFSQIVSVVIQLVSLPVFLHYWTVEQYGVWLMISAIPAYFSMVDGGLVAVAANRMTMLTTQGCLRESNAIFQSALFMVSASLCGFGLVAVGGVFLADHYVPYLNEYKLTLVLLIFVALGNLFFGLFDAVYRASGHYARSVNLSSVSRLLEWVSGLIGLIAFGDFLHVAIGMFAGRLGSTCVLVLHTAKRFPDFEWSFRHASVQVIRELVRPSLAFLAFPAGNAISLQGVTLVVGATLGPTFLTMFSAYRTLSRVVTQMVTAISRSIWPEISVAYSKKDYRLVRALYRKGTLVSVVLSCVVGFLVYASAEEILAFWSKGKVPYSNSQFILFLISAVCTAFWQAGMVVLMAINLHGRFAFVFLISSLLVVAQILLLHPLIGQLAPVVSLISFELLMLAASFLMVRELFNKIGAYGS